jgi:hypothetical protein
MGLCIALINEGGENLAFITDDKNFLHKLLPPADDDSSPMLASIDWYGDTVFNSVQMRRFIPEWNILKQRTRNVEEQQLVAAVERLAERCKDEVHLYLKFIGD